MMRQELQNDLIEFEAWFQHHLAIIDFKLLAAGSVDDPIREEIAQLRRSKLIHIEKSSRIIMKIYSKHGFYPEQ